MTHRNDVEGPMDCSSPYLAPALFTELQVPWSQGSCLFADVVLHFLVQSLAYIGKLKKCQLKD